MPPDDAALRDKPRFLVDQNVQESVCKFLSEQGYEVARTSELTAPDAPDNLIAFVASHDGLILVSHDRDFKRFAHLFPVGQRATFRRGAGQIIIQVRENQARERLSVLWESILFHYQLAQRQGIRFYATVSDNNVTYTDNAPISRSRKQPRR